MADFTTPPTDSPIHAHSIQSSNHVKGSWTHSSPSAPVIHPERPLGTCGRSSSGMSADPRHILPLLESFWPLITFISGRLTIFLICCYFFDRTVWSSNKAQSHLDPLPLRCTRENSNPSCRPQREESRDKIMIIQPLDYLGRERERGGWGEEEERER